MLQNLQEFRESAAQELQKKQMDLMTPLLESSLQDPNFGPAVKQLPVPVGGFGSPSLIAEWIAMMLSPSADFMCGSLVFVDGGSDALIRPNDWPKSLSI